MCYDLESMASEYMVKGIRVLSSGINRVIVCTTCGVVVAEDFGRPIDVPLVELAVRRHTDHPRSELTEGIYHQIETAFVKTSLGVVGVNLWNGVENIM